MFQFLARDKTGAWVPLQLFTAAERLPRYDAHSPWNFGAEGDHTRQATVFGVSMERARQV